jgi:hypothetical protein
MILLYIIALLSLALDLVLGRSRMEQLQLKLYKKLSGKDIGT